MWSAIFVVYTYTGKVQPSRQCVCQNECARISFVTYIPLLFLIGQCDQFVDISSFFRSKTCLWFWVKFVREWWYMYLNQSKISWQSLMSINKILPLKRLRNSCRIVWRDNLRLFIGHILDFSTKGMTDLCHTLCGVSIAWDYMMTLTATTLFFVVA